MTRQGKSTNLDKDSGNVSSNSNDDPKVAISLKPSPLLALVIPCYNEEDALKETSKVVRDKLASLKKDHAIDPSSFVILVDDGSTDKTWQEISALHDKEPELFHGVKFSHNRGHQNALYAGLMQARALKADAAVSMDADLQDDPNAIDAMVEEYRKGAEIVYGVRDNRDTDTVFKRSSAHAFYRLMHWMGTETIPDHADYRLMSRAALDALSEYTEVNLFLRGIVPSLGFKTAKVYYKRSERVAGESKYPLRKMVSFAIDGVTSFSVKPLSAITAIGAISVIFGIIMLIYTIASLCAGHAQAGWASIMCSLWIIGGLILTALGIVGEYIGRIYLEVKQRPRYIIEKTI
ncbi:glycosyltransferase family 2 protein [Bifidobacterium sp. ESL0690]|uniref:glycosyltransferase family 2 protein n=1 Tax=Bifidobacterium sp. ESL0690 TaxID=2983214 RepID=UPI0023F95E28|nr:glycosyltransferase family 2 protein [Bifidobacterium sp. ESL0690]WEV46572.1 glycosyltransferase family 2 protein [Bifidobacterium sp. ESL0690]